MSKKNIPQHINNRFQQVYWTFYLCNSSLTELHHLTNQKFESDEIEMINSHPFSFYRVTLQYTFILEFNKLFEKGRNNKEGVSSLIKLNELLRNELGNDFEETYEENLNIIEEIKSSEYFQNIITLRNKKFAHSEKHSENLPFKVKGLTTEKIFESFEYLKKLSEIIKKCTLCYDFEYDLSIPTSETRTLNFIKLQSKYKQHFYKSK